MSRSKGFSLVELLVGLAIGAAGVAVAAYFAGAAVKKTNRGDQINDLSSSVRILGRQFRSDLRLAGYGTTGAIGVSDASGFWNGVLTPSVGNFPAMPVIAGADNVAGNVISDGGGVGNMAGTDIIAVVVPDPSSIVLPNTTPAIAANAPFPAPPPCPSFFMIADYSSPNGGGRSQLVNPLINERAMFNVAAGATILCARLSVYWVDTNRLLRRTDLTPAGGAPFLIGGTQVPWQNGATAIADAVTPGVIDFQAAYAFSSEFAGRNPAVRWAFPEPAVPSVDPTGNPRAWFEVRQVRVSMYVRTLRAADDTPPRGVEAPLENSAVAYNPRDFGLAYSVERVVNSESLNNLRFFDMNLPSGVAAEPY